MHFGRSIYFFFTSGDVLTVISPIDSTFIIIVLVSSFVTAWVFVGTGRGRKIAPWVWNFLIMTLVLSVTTAHFKVVLDGARGKAYVTTVLFFRPTHYEYPLSDIQGASVGESDQADALRLVFNGGSSLQLSPYNQMRGKGEAAFAINQFIQQHGGAGAP
jgi:hypothetical protein